MIVVKIRPWIVLAWLVGATVAIAPADLAAQSRQDLMRAIEANMQDITAVMTRQKQQGYDVEAARQLMLQEFSPLMQQGRLADAKQVQERVLAMLRVGQGVPAPAPTLKPSVASAPMRATVTTDEVQYLVFTPEPRDFETLRTLDRIVAEYVKRMRGMQQGQRRKWGMSVILPSWTAPPEALRAFIRQAFDLAASNDIAFHFTVESLDWQTRNDLWNYKDRDKPGYDPANIGNVEWSDWDKKGFPYRFRDWGTPEQMAPVICYNSPKVLSAVAKILNDGIGPALVAGVKRLERDGKVHLFAGVTVGSEPELPNYEHVDRFNPGMAQLMKRLGVPQARLGYCSLTNLGYSKSNPPADFAKALASVNHAYVEYWAKLLHGAGISKDKMYTHIAAGAGVVGSPEVEHTNAPISIAFNKYSRPGWTTYPNGPLEDNFNVLFDALAANGNPHWGGTEANPRGLGQRGMAMEAYLKRHFDYGATLVVMNVGATSEALMRRLHDAVWGQEALEAYRSFLKSR